MQFLLHTKSHIPMTESSLGSQVTTKLYSNLQKVTADQTSEPYKLERKIILLKYNSYV